MCVCVCVCEATYHETVRVLLVALKEYTEALEPDLRALIEQVIPVMLLPSL